MLDPLTLKLLDSNYVQQNAILPVTSAFIREPSTNEFHPEGLFSETIFGEVGSTQRLIKFGYIDLRMQCFHPLVYKNLLQLKRIYGDIMSGKIFARFDEVEKDFVKCESDAPGAGSGYTFFISNFNKVVFKDSPSLKRQDKINILKKYKDNIYIQKYLVLPAGVRDVKVEDDVTKLDTINTLYNSLLKKTLSLPDRKTTNPIYDSIKFSIQRSANEIYAHIFDILEGKNGFLQHKFGARSLTLGTRNVISSAHFDHMSPTDPKFLKVNETGVPLFQATKMFQPIVSNKFRQIFFDPIISQEANNIAVIDPKTLRLVYKEVSEEDKKRFITTDGIDNFINLYKNRVFRKEPLNIFIDKKEKYYLWLVYDEGDAIYLFRNIHEFKSKMEEKGLTFKRELVRPLTNMEMFYIAVESACMGKHALVTRYPAIESGSIYESKVHLLSTQPSRTIKLKSLDNEYAGKVLAEYPILENPSIDSLIVHPTYLAGLNGDYDGDMVNCTGVLSEEANEECAKHMAELSSIVKPNLNLLYGASTDLIKITMFYLSMDPIKEDNRVRELDKSLIEEKIN